MEGASEIKLEEKETIEKDKVLFKREWSFWENYESKNQKEKDYSKLIKEIYSFNDIISFWQFWNNYPGNDIKKYFSMENFYDFFLRKNIE